MKRLYYVIYRTGTPENPHWQQSEPLPKLEAVALAKNLSKNGFKAFTVSKRQSEALGLPEGWEYRKS
jgi:hypothetical protein